MVNDDIEFFTYLAVNLIKKETSYILFNIFQILKNVLNESTRVKFFFISTTHFFHNLLQSGSANLLDY